MTNNPIPMTPKLISALALLCSKNIQHKLMKELVNVNFAIGDKISFTYCLNFGSVASGRYLHLTDSEGNVHTFDLQA